MEGGRNRSQQHVNRLSIDGSHRAGSNVPMPGRPSLEQLHIQALNKTQHTLNGEPLPSPKANSKEHALAATSYSSVYDAASETEALLYARMLYVCIAVPT